MCGVAGFYTGRGCTEATARQLLRRMGDKIVHRGPDQDGGWVDGGPGIALASRRLAILDLSPMGDQPMCSAGGRFVLSYNGEIYNHAELRREIGDSSRGTVWRGSSDTETLLAAFELWGVETTLKRALGMFAFALWDRVSRTLTLARDRIGEKPMYYGWQGSGQNKVFLFGSELKALAGHPSFEGQIDRNALAAFMQDGYVPTPASIYRGIFKLCPGSTLTLRGSGSEPVVTTYWSARAAVLEGVSHRSELSEVQAIAELEDLLASSVAGQLNSDAPVGAFLSGGIDSSLIVALMQRASNATVQTFTIGFEDGRFDEAPYSRRVAEHLGTMHHELTMTESDVLRILPLMPTVYDEPFADSSQIPTFMVAQLARARVKVALSGEGADEIFGGYDSYLYASRLWRQLSQVPASLRKLAARAIEAVPAAAWNTIGYITRHSRHSTGSDKAYKCSLLLRSNSPSELRRAFVQRWPAGTVIGTAGPANAEPAIPANAAENMMAIDLQQYLPDDILVKVDRAAMAVSLETRAPYLDRRVVEFAWRLPSSMKIRHGSSKWILRQLLSKYVPEALFRRPKRGFSIPVDQLLRGALRNWAEALLDPDRLRAQGYIDPNSVQLAWHRHLNGDSNRQAQLWTVLMFQAWLEARSTEGAGGQNLIAL